MRAGALIMGCAAGAGLAAGAMFGSLVHAQQRALDRDLIAAGFTMRPADTAAKRERLRAIPPHRFAARTANGQRYYVYADPADCVCAFVGTQKALDAYRDMRKPMQAPPGVQDFANAPRGPSAENLMIHEMDEDAGVMDGNDIFHFRFD
jgi:hypothetical protein